MHQALTIDEILDDIFRHLVSRRQLVNVALVCRAWSEPAFNLLWAKLTDLRAIFSLLAPLQRAICIPEKAESFQWVFATQSASPPQVDWIRFNRFLRHVRVIEITFNAASFHPSLWKALADFVPHGGGFPKMLKLSIRDLSSAQSSNFPFLSPALLCLSGPNTRTITYHGTLDCSALPKHLQRSTILHRSFPFLTNLTLRNVIQTAELADFIKRSERLESVTLLRQLATPKIWMALTTCPTLRHLTLDRPTWYLKALVKGSSKHLKIFPQLETFSLSGDAGDIMELLRSQVLPQGLQGLNISVVGDLYDREDHRTIRGPDLYGAITMAVPNLASLDIACPEYYFNRAFTEIENLHALQALKHLGLRFGDVPHLSRVSVRSLLLSLPILRSIKLTGVDIDHGTGISIHVLEDFAAYCPEIEHITMAVGEPGAEDGSFDGTLPRLLNLKCLNILRSRIQHVEPIASYLVRRASWKMCLKHEFVGKPTPSDTDISHRLWRIVQQRVDLGITCS